MKWTPIKSAVAISGIALAGFIIGLSVTFFGSRERVQYAPLPDVEERNFATLDQILWQLNPTFRKPNLDSTVQMAMVDNIAAAAPCPKPQKLADLNSGFKYQSYQFTSKDDKSIKLFGFVGHLNSRDVLLVQDYIEYKDVQCKNNDTIRLGVGLRLYVHVMDVKKGADVSTLPHLAASVELSKATAIYYLDGLGFRMPDEAKAGLFNTTPKTLNVDNYGSIVEAYGKIGSLLKDGIPGLSFDFKVLPRD